MPISKTVLFAVSLLALGASCASSDDNSEEELAVSDQALTAVASFNFSSDPIGPLGAPWTVNSTTGGSLSVVNSTADHGKVLRAHFDDYSSLSATTPISSNTGPNLDVQFDVKLLATQAFVLELQGTRSSAYGKRRTLHFNWMPGGEFEDDLTGVCGKVPLGSWAHVRFLFRTDTHLYDAWVNGVPACTGRRFSDTFNFPTLSFTLRNSFLYVFHGDILFDNISVQTGAL